MYAIGIDMSKETFHACFEGDIVQTFNNTEQGIDQFMTHMEEYGFIQGKTLIGVEATGVYHLLLAVTLSDNEWDVKVINPLESHKFITAGIRTVKTDRLDAIKIAEMVTLGRGYLFLETKESIVLKALVVERSAVVEMRKQTKQRLQAHDIKMDAIGTPLTDYLTPIIETLTATIESIDQEMQQHEQETQKLLKTIPGIGDTTAASLVAFVGNIYRFDSPQKLVAYIGLDPRVYESGTSVKGKGYISKRGNKYLRHILFNAAFTAKRCNPEFTRYYEKKIAQGKHHTSIICALERKLVHVIYAVWSRQTPFEK